MFHSMKDTSLPAIVGLVLSFLSCFSSVAATAQPREQYVDWVINATNVLDQWYNTSTGLWANTWWNSGCMLTTMGNVALIDKGMFADAIESYMTLTYHKNLATKLDLSFVNSFYDDEGWWALGWIKAYDVTGNLTYLSMAASIAENMVGGTNATCGGHWWNKHETASDTPQGNTAIGNTLYLATVASLGNRVPANATYYQKLAQQEMNFFLTSRIIDNETWTLHDNLDIHDGCKPADWTFSYTMGSFMGGLIEFAKLSGNDSYLDMADKVANGTIYNLGGAKFKGILTDMGYPGEPTNTLVAQFKGVFIRSLMYLQQVRPDERWASFIQNNANSIYNTNRAPNGTLGSLWQGPFYYTGVQGHSSALDGLVAAAMITK